MKIVSTGSTLSSPEFHEKKLRARRRKALIWSSVALIVFIIFVLASHINKIRIKNVNVVGAKVVSPESVAAAVKDSIGGDYLWLIPKNNALIYPKSAVEVSLEKKFPRFSSINISFANIETLNISVVEREPYALYCGSQAQMDESSACYFLDKEGYIFDAAPAFSQGVYFVYAADAPLDEPLGKQYLPSDEFKSMNDFISSLGALGIHPVSLTESDDSFTLSLTNQAKITWRRSSDLAQVYSNLDSFLNSSDIKSQKDFFDKLLELDLRTENKVFYRFKQ